MTVFLACAVEAVEGFTIVLAAGTARGWRSAASGAVAAVAVLVVVVAALGPAITALPLDGLRFVVGSLLLVFGLQWLRKAILRASGNKAHRDEAVAYAATLAAAHTSPSSRRTAGLDWYAFTLSFKGILLEGIEVAFIALTLGANHGSISLAALAAASAVAVVAIAGLAIRAPLARVPENAMKFFVGVMLTAFGIYWGAEGAGAHWPGEDLALLVLIPAVALYALALSALFKRRATTPATTQPTRAS
ncbi:hypothetical protein [Mycolicibacterium arenosum]|uniref:GDT1 family protein n=1 Tax=Mycolicibacterium arenosum TaxID=2952157 RepID=A0ABT1MBB3_9MYCO|nr:hypothetical protein [Mycolicibacterium sp. CAU 1645]MCP9276459.1 hypothetical protein [Mycolicibacterium sp. CAU 1645]